VRRLFIPPYGSGLPQGERCPTHLYICRCTYRGVSSRAVQGIQKARDVGFIDWNSGSRNWSIEEYQHYEQVRKNGLPASIYSPLPKGSHGMSHGLCPQVENGDLNWIMPKKLLAFSGPASRSNEVPGYRLHTPEDYWDYFRRKGITAVVRLNKKVWRTLDPPTKPSRGMPHPRMQIRDGRKDGLSAHIRPCTDDYARLPPTHTRPPGIRQTSIHGRRLQALRPVLPRWQLSFGGHPAQVA